MWKSVCSMAQLDHFQANINAICSRDLTHKPIVSICVEALELDRHTNEKLLESLLCGIPAWLLKLQRIDADDSGTEDA